MPVSSRLLALMLPLPIRCHARAETAARQPPSFILFCLSPRRCAATVFRTWRHVMAPLSPRGDAGHYAFHHGAVLIAMRCLIGTRMPRKTPYARTAIYLLLEAPASHTQSSRDEDFRRIILLRRASARGRHAVDGNISLFASSSAPFAYFLRPSPGVAVGTIDARPAMTCAGRSMLWPKRRRRCIDDGSLVAARARVKRKRAAGWGLANRGARTAAPFIPATQPERSRYRLRG